MTLIIIAMIILVLGGTTIGLIVAGVKVNSSQVQSRRPVPQPQAQEVRPSVKASDNSVKPEQLEPESLPTCSGRIFLLLFYFIFASFGLGFAYLTIVPMLNTINLCPITLIAFGAFFIGILTISAIVRGGKMNNGSTFPESRHDGLFQGRYGGLVQGLLAMGVGLACIAGGRFMFASKQEQLARFKNIAIATQAKVINQRTDVSHDSESGDTTHYYITYQYEVPLPQGDQQRFTREVEVGNPIEVGASISILYASTNPGDSYTQGEANHIDNTNAAVLICGGFLPLFLSPLMILFWARTRKPIVAY